MRLRKGAHPFLVSKHAQTSDKRTSSKAASAGRGRAAPRCGRVRAASYGEIATSP